MSDEGRLTESGEPGFRRPLRDHWVLQHIKRPKSRDVGRETIASQIEDDFPCPEDHTASHVCPQKIPESLFFRRVKQAGSWGEGFPEILLSLPSLSVALHLVKQQLFYI